MKNSYYTESIKKIKAPQSLIENTKELMRGGERESEVLLMDKPKHSGLKITSAVAAIIALIIGLSFLPFEKDSEHSFIITVGAAEIPSDVYVEIGELENRGGGALFHTIKEEENNNFGMKGTYSIINIHREFYPYDFNIEGEDIESVTYTANNCMLAYDTEFEGIVDVNKIPIEELQKENGTVYYSNSYDWAKYCTLDYQSQFSSIKGGDWKRVPKIGVNFHFNFDEGEYVEQSNNENYIDTEPMFEEQFNAHADEFSLSISANFKDGVNVTKTLKFKCKNTDDRGLVLYAKES